MVAGIMIIREAVDADFEQLYKLYMDKTVNPYLSFEIMSIEEFKPIYNELINSVDKHFVLCEGDTIISTVMITRYSRRIAHIATIRTLATLPSYHGQGVTKKLMLEIISRLKEDGIRRVDLMAEVDNPKAIKFYQKLGFEKEGILKDCYKRASDDHYIDEILMAKLI